MQYLLERRRSNANTMQINSITDTQIETALWRNNSESVCQHVCPPGLWKKKKEKRKKERKFVLCSMCRTEHKRDHVLNWMSLCGLISGVLTSCHALTEMDISFNFKLLLEITCIALLQQWDSRQILFSWTECLHHPLKALWKFKRNFC